MTAVYMQNQNPPQMQMPECTNNNNATTSNAITLSFNGVDFRLIPSDESGTGSGSESSSSISMVNDSSGKFTVMNLKSFTGSLIVSSSPTFGNTSDTRNVNIDMNMNTDVNIDTHTNPNKATTVEDEPPSPESHKDMSEIMGAGLDGNKLKSKSSSATVVSLPGGQQQLPFGLSNKKRSHNKNKNENDSSRKSKKLCKTKTKSNSNSSKTVPTLAQSQASQLEMSQGSYPSQHVNAQEQVQAAEMKTMSEPNVKKVKSPSTIKELVQREEMNGTQMDEDVEEEPTQIFEDKMEMERQEDMDDTNGNRNCVDNDDAILEYISEEEVDDALGNFHFSQSPEKVIATSQFSQSQSSVSLVTVKEDKNKPCPRWGHTMNLIDGNKILVYGGQAYDEKEGKNKTLKDLHVYDMEKRTWTNPVNCEGMPRCWHSASYLPDRQLLISFGGEAFNEKTKKTVTTDQVMVLDTEIMLWYPPSVSGKVPSGRSGHTASLLQNELVVFGGVKNNKWQKSLAVLDTMRWMWSTPKITGDAPRARSYHSATPVPDSNLLVIFGGNNETQCFNSVHVLGTNNDEKSWFHPTVSGTPPCPRTGHVATLLEDGKTILVYGGWDPNVDENEQDSSDEDLIFGDSFLLDTATWTWRPGPKPKFAPHQLGTVNGGLKRVGSTAILAPGVDMTQMLVFGGRIPGDRFANDFQTTTVAQRMLGM